MCIRDRSLEEADRRVVGRSGESHADVLRAEVHRVGNSAAMYFGPEYVRVALAGATDYAPIGFFEGPFVFADLDTLSARMPDGLNATSTLVVGPGAAQAVAVGVGQVH